MDVTFGSESRYDPHVKIIQIDIAAEELGNGRDIAIGLCGDATAIIQQCIDMIHSKKIQLPEWKEWKQSLHNVVTKNEFTLQRLTKNRNDPITYYRAFAAIKATLPASTIIVSEGANTMDIGRTMLSSHQPRSRLDAGTFATMGVGVGIVLLQLLLIVVIVMVSYQRGLLLLKVIVPLVLVQWIMKQLYDINYQ